MNFSLRRGDARTGSIYILMTAIAATALIAAGLTLQFQGQRDALVISKDGGSSQSVAVALAQTAALTGIQLSRDGAARSADYCPLGPADARAGRGKSLCSMIGGTIFSLGALGNTDFLGWIREAAGAGVSKITPAIRLLVGTCFPFLR